MLYRSIVLFVVDFGCGETKYTKLYRKDYITTVSCSEYRYEAVKYLVSNFNVLRKPSEKARNSLFGSRLDISPLKPNQIRLLE